MKTITININDAEVNCNFYNLINYSGNGYYVCAGTDESENDYEVYFEMPDMEVQDAHDNDASEFMDWSTPAFIICDGKVFTGEHKIIGEN